MIEPIIYSVVGLVVTAVVVVLILASMKPDTFRIERSATIKASPARVFALVEDFHNWGGWSPWEKLDPNLKRTYSGQPASTGAVYEWEGNKQVGQGRMEITEALPPAKVVIRLDFLKPFEAHNVAEFTLEPEGDSTVVTWAMHGPRPFLFKVMTVFLSMDAMIGKDFETGLANMKALAEE